MQTFLIVTGIILWILLAFAAGVGAFILAEEFGPWGFVGGGAACILLFAGLITLGIGTGFFSDELPPDGCYRVERDTEYVPVSSGKVISVIPVEDAQFIPIGCP